MWKWIPTVSVALALVGCASTGVQVSDEQILQYVPGQTTKQDVLAGLGRPTTQMRNADGTSTLLYTHAEVRTRPSTYIPFVGAFIGGADSRSSNVMLTFDREDRLLTTSSSSSEYGTGLGASAGSVAPVVNQPRKTP